MSPFIRPALALLAAGLVAGCDALSPSDSDDDLARQPAILAFGEDDAEIALPDTVAVGAPAALVVTTQGGGCIRQGETEVEAAPRAADVRVYDYFPRPSSELVCTADIRALAHEATLRFTQPGTATVRVHGRRGYGTVPLVVTRTIVVR